MTPSDQEMYDMVDENGYPMFAVLMDMAREAKDKEAQRKQEERITKIDTLTTEEHVSN